MKELPVHQPKHAPVTHLMVYVTEDCNLRCTYCFVKKTPKSMTLETGRKLVDYYFQREISGTQRTLTFTFFGGEPFMALDTMEEIAAHACGTAKGRTLSFNATTNATLATPEVERIVRRYEMGLLVSLDGGPESMESRPFLGGGSPYRAVERNLKRLCSWSPQVVARMTYHPESLDIVGNAKKIFELGAPAIAICAVVESDWRGKEQQLEEAYQELADWFLCQARQGRWLALEVEWRLLRFYHLHHAWGGRPRRPCTVGTSLIAVNTEGQVMPCHRFLYRPHDWFGTVDDVAFPPQRDSYVQLASANILGCDDCHARSICGGGCRYLAITAQQDIATGAHPGHCLVTRAQSLAVRRIYETLMEECQEDFLAHLLSRPSPVNYFGELAI